MPVTRDAVVWGYRLILGRDPRAPEEIEPRLALQNHWSLVADLLTSEEFVTSGRHQAVFGHVTGKNVRKAVAGKGRAAAKRKAHRPSREAVVWAYRLFLAREPESDLVVTDKLRARDGLELLQAFVLCDEYLAKESRRLSLVVPVIPEPDCLVPLTPRALGPRLENLRLLALGPCIFDALVAPPVPFGHRVDHHLLLTGTPVSEFIQVDEYDAIIVALVFRDVWKVATGNESDVIHVGINDAADADRLLQDSARALRQRVFELHPVLKARPTFFLSFIEPSFNFLGNFADPFESLSLRTLVSKLNEQLSLIVREQPNFYLLEINQLLNSVGRVGLQDDLLTHFTHNALRAEVDRRVLQEMGVPLASGGPIDIRRPLRALKQVLFDTLSDNVKILRQLDVVKLIVVDLDDTLWRGVAAEEEVATLTTNTAYTEGWPLGFVEALLYFKRRGGLLAICSKNEYQPTVERFAAIWRTEITLDDFVSVKINWNNKADNLASILSEVNVLPEHTLFIDDNPRELDEVRSRHPQVRCLGGDQATWRGIILRSPETQVPAFSAESARRTQLVRATISRSALPVETDRGTWLRSLDLVQRFSVVRNTGDPLFARAMELINKTNQFNTTGVRWSLAQLDEFFSDGGVCVLTSLRDKITDNGTVGSLLLRGNDIVQVVLSCRVFGLGAEVGLGRLAVTSGLRHHSSVTGTIVDTGRNFSCHGYFSSLGFAGSAGRFETSTICAGVEWIRTECDDSCELIGAR